MQVQSLCKKVGLKERVQSVLHVTLAGRRRMRVVVFGTVLVPKAAALHIILEAGEPKRATRYVIGQAREQYLYKSDNSSQFLELVNT